MEPGAQWIVSVRAKVAKQSNSKHPYPPPLYIFLLQICTNYKNDQIDRVKSGNPLKSGKFSSLSFTPTSFLRKYSIAHFPRKRQKPAVLIAFLILYVTDNYL